MPCVTQILITSLDYYKHLRLDGKVISTAAGRFPNNLSSGLCAKSVSASPSSDTGPVMKVHFKSINKQPHYSLVSVRKQFFLNLITESYLLYTQ